MTKEENNSPTKMTKSVLKIFSDKIKDLKQKNLYRKLTSISFVSDNVVSTPSLRGVFATKKSNIFSGLPRLCFAKPRNDKITSFASNDYLGLANNKKVKKSAIKSIKKYGTSCKSSRYIAGNNEIYQKLENKLAKFYGSDDSIVFSSGYQAAIGAIPALVQKGDLIIADKLIHSCLIDGAKLSNAKLLRYHHNDLAHLQKLLAENKEKYEKILIITEEIFSMDGDLAPLGEIQKIATQNHALLLIDSAHSLYEKKRVIARSHGRRGNPENFGPETIFLGTFSKALGSFGGYVTSNSTIIDYLRNFSKSAIYTTALPPATLAANLESLNIVSKENLAQKTLSNAKYLCELLAIEFRNSAIIIVEIDNIEKTLQIGEELKKRGFLISTIRPPTSPTARLRITVNAKHTKKQIENFAKALQVTIANVHKLGSILCHSES